MLIYMMKTTEKELSGFHRSQMSQIKSKRTRHIVIQNPSNASPSDQLYIDIPKLEENSCLISGYLHLCFEFKISKTK